jgi:battenin
MFLRFWVLLEHPNKDVTQITQHSSESNKQNQTVSSKISYMPQLMKFMIPLGLVYFFEYLINQGLVSFN